MGGGKPPAREPAWDERGWDAGHFLLKGLEGVRGEFSLSVLAYNLRRAISLLGVECLLAILRSRKMAVKGALGPA